VADDNRWVDGQIAGHDAIDSSRTPARVLKRNTSRVNISIARAPIPPPHLSTARRVACTHSQLSGPRGRGFAIDIGLAHARTLPHGFRNLCLEHQELIFQRATPRGDIRGQWNI
jgi:hypothetical protein